MTVCIATICKEGIIFGASDRMITSSDVQFEPSSQKIYQLSSSILVMTAGDSALQTEIFFEVYNIVSERIKSQPSNWWLVKDVADLYLKYRNLAKLKRAENAIFVPLGLDRNSFIEHHRLLSENIADQLTKELINYDISSMSVIIAGVDPYGPHIYVVEDGSISCLDSIGFAAIGSGARHAQSQFMLAGYGKGASVPEAVLLTYTAKKRSEVAPGVGHETDMFMIGPLLGSYSQILPEALTKLDKEYQNLRKKESKALDKAKEEIKSYVEKPKEGKAASQEIPKTDGGEASSDSTKV